MKKKFAAWLLVLCMLIGVLSACGSTAAPASSAAAPESAAEEAAEAPAQEEAEAPETVAAAPEAEGSAVSAVEEGAPVDADAVPYEDTFEEGAGVWPICDPGEKTITIWDGWFPFFSAFFESFDDTLFFQEMEKRTGVKTEFTLVNAEQAAEQFNLMVATGDYRDLMHDVDTNYVGGLDKAWEDEVIIPIDDLMSEWMPNYKKVIYSNAKFVDDLTSDEGNMYLISIVREDPGFPDYGLVIRQDWLDKIGKDRPETYDEYYDVLTAFKNEIGASAPMMLSNCGSYPGNFFCSGFGVNGSLVNGSQPFYQVDGQVKYGPMEEGYKKYLETMAKWYSEGLIYQDFYTHFESNTMPPDGLVTGDQMGVFGCNTQDIAERYNSVTGTNEELRLVAAFDPVENKGDTTHFASDRTGEAGGGYCISTACEDLETVARWADYIYTEEGQLLSNFGVEGETFDYDENGEPKLGDLILHNEIMPTMLAITKYTTFNLVGVEDAYRMYAEYTPEQWEAGEIWSMGDSDYTIPRKVSMTTEESEIFASTYSDIATYVAEHTLSVILGKENIDDLWDEYVSNIESMDIATCIEQQQSAYDRYME